MRGMWTAAQAMQKGSHAVPNEEISLETLRFFLTMATTTTTTAEVAKVSDRQKMVDPGSGWEEYNVQLQKMYHTDMYVCM